MNASEKIRVYPDPVLRKVALPIQGIDDDVVHLAQEMAGIMYGAPGIGLAAPQVGVSQRLIVVDVTYTQGKNGLITLVNPEIVEAEGYVEYEEGCLSVPGCNEVVERAQRVLVRGVDLEGNEHRIEADGLLAIALQHEIDHLQGILFIDRLSSLKRNIIRRKLRKLTQPD